MALNRSCTHRADSKLIYSQISGVQFPEGLLFRPPMGPIQREDHLVVHGEHPVQPLLLVGEEPLATVENVLSHAVGQADVLQALHVGVRFGIPGVVEMVVDGVKAIGGSGGGTGCGRHGAHSSRDAGEMMAPRACDAHDRHSDQKREGPAWLPDGRIRIR